MKDIRREKNIFDVMDFENLTEEEWESMNERIIEPNDIDYRTIRNGVFEQLNLNPKKKKHFSRKALTIGLIAAAICISAIGIGVTASGSFRQIFGGFMEGDTPDAVGTGSHLSVNCEKNQIDLHGLCGNGTSVYAVYTIEKKDGTDFVKDYRNTFTLYEGNLFESFPDYEGPGAEEDPNYGSGCLDPDKRGIWATKGGILTGDEELPVVYGTFDYRFESNRSIKVFANCHSNEDNLRGNTLHLRDRTINAYTPVSTIYRYAKDGKEICSEVIEGLKTDYPDLYQSFLAISKNACSEKPKELPENTINEAYDFIRQIRKAYRPLLKENEVIIMDGILQGWKICEKTALDLNYEISVRMDYQSTTRRLEIDSEKELVYTPDPDTVFADDPDYNPAEHRHEPVTFTVESIEADSFSIRIKTHSEPATEYRSLLFDSLCRNATIELLDGTRYDTWSIGIHSQETTESNTDDLFQFFYYSFSENEYTGKPVGIDPSDIKAIYLGSTRLYGE